VGVRGGRCQVATRPPGAGDRQLLQGALAGEGAEKWCISSSWRRG
jgi:hypothetical protein